MRRDCTTPTPQPNAGHGALVDLERQGRLRALVTQNIDGLHQAAGLDPDAGARDPRHRARGRVPVAAATGRRCASALDRVDGGEPDPACLVCGGILKSATV